MFARDWREEDIPTIAELEKVCFTDAWSEQTFLSAFHSPYFVGVVLEEKGEIVAYACASAVFEDSEIGVVAVAKEWRRQGLGKRLIAELCSRSKMRGAENMFLEVRVSNANALALYRNVGFEKFGVRKRYYPDGEDAFVMRKSLVDTNR